MNQNTIILHAMPLDEEGFAFYATIYENELDIPYTEPWENLAFAWHKPSYYGTCLQTKTIDNQTYTLLSHYEAFDFFLTKPWNDWASFEFGMDCVPYINWAKEIYAHIQADEIQPYYVKDNEDMPNLVWGTEVNENPEWSDWFNHILHSVCLSNHSFYAKYLEKYARSYLMKLFARILPEDEESFYELIQWTPKPKSYELAIQLLEPENQSTDETETKLWQLQVMIRPQSIQDAPWLLYEKRNMHKYNFLTEKDNQTITKKLDNWCERFPFLGHGQVNQNLLPIGRSLSEDEAYLFLMEIAPQLVQEKIMVILPSWWKDIQKKKWTLQTIVGEEKQSSVMPLVWREFDWKLAVGDAEISEAEFIAALQAGKRMMQVGNEWMLLDEQILKEIQAYVKNAKKKGFSLRQMIAGQKQVTQNEEEMTETNFHVEMKVTPIWHRSFRQLFELNSEEKISLEDAFQGSLRDYQQIAANWLCDRYTRKLGAILADDMGLGKTVMVIAYFLYLRGLAKGVTSGFVSDEERKTPILLICPTSLLGNWEMELEKFAPKLQVLTHYGTNRAKKEDEFLAQTQQVDIVLTSYGLVANDSLILSAVTWQSIVLDEAQNIKNHATKQSRTIRSLPAQHHIALTGTPVENRLLELWTLFDFIQPDYLGGITAFKREYISPIEGYGDERKQQALKALIQPFLLRRTKKDKDIRLDLPDKLEQKSFLHLNVEQAALYYQLVEKCKESQYETNPLKQKGLILTALNHFKMICDHPALYLGETKNHKWTERSPKLTHCIELVKNILDQEEQVLIFTQYIDMAKILQFALKKHFKIDVPFFHGGLNKNARDQLVKNFQNRKSPILILSLKAGGTGLTLTAANHVIHFDRWWNPAVENQATDRVHRIGQESFVHVHKLIMKGTIEEKIDALMDKKQDLSDQILSPESWLGQMSFDDFLRMVI